MQSEYGWKGYSEDSREVKGLKQLFPSKVSVFSLDEESSRRRGLTPDYVVRIGFDEIEPEDIQMLRESLNLSEVAADASYFASAPLRKGVALPLPGTPRGRRVRRAGEGAQRERRCSRHAQEEAVQA